MPVYTCTIRESSLSADIKAALAREMACVHSSVNNVPTTYVNVAFHELSADSVYTDGIPSNPVLVSGWVRAGHPEAETTRLSTESPLQSPGSLVSPPSESLSSSKAVQRDSPSRAVVSCPSPVTNKPGPQARANRTTT